MKHVHILMIHVCTVVNYCTKIDKLITNLIIEMRVVYDYPIDVQKEDFDIFEYKVENIL